MLYIFLLHQIYGQKNCMIYAIWCQHSYTQPLFIYQSNYCQKWIYVTSCQTDLILTIKYVIVSKRVPNLIWQAYYKLLKIYFLYRHCRANEKLGQIWCFTSTSAVVFSFEKFSTVNLKTYGHMDPLNFLENVLLEILKNVMLTVPFSVTTKAVPYF